MSEVINAVVVVDTEGLKAAFPHGLSRHATGNPNDINKFFTVLVDEAHQDGPNGIACSISDTIYFNAIPKGNDADDVIISEFADKNINLDAGQLIDYITVPRFNSSNAQGFSYNNADFPSHETWNKWSMWFAPLISNGTVKYSHMSVEALKSTIGLADDCISYTLGFKISYPNQVLDFYFDPTIKITNS